MSKWGVISGLYFPLRGLNTGKYGPEITPHLDTFHAGLQLGASFSRNMTIEARNYDPAMLRIVQKQLTRGVP